MPKRKYVVYLKNVDRQIVITDDKDDPTPIEKIKNSLSEYMSGHKNFTLSNKTDNIIINPFSVSAIHVETIEGSDEFNNDVDIDIDDDVIIEDEEEENQEVVKTKKNKGSIKAKKKGEVFDIEKLETLIDVGDEDESEEKEDEDSESEDIDTKLEEDIEEDEEEDLDEVQTWHNMIDKEEEE